ARSTGRRRTRWAAGWAPPAATRTPRPATSPSLQIDSAKGEWLQSWKVRHQKWGQQRQSARNSARPCWHIFKDPWGSLSQNN
ncbi:unnamed protein product, partial [Heterosigma akashiwo]